MNCGTEFFVKKYINLYDMDPSECWSSHPQDCLNVSVLLVTDLHWSMPGECLHFKSPRDQSEIRDC